MSEPGDGRWDGAGRGEGETASAAAAAPVGCAPGIGTLVGPYKLLSVLGEGGFGIVYLAERREPIVQRVALKVIKPGMDSRAVLGRFEQERQALAVMDHPNIARVFDAGATAEGRPYFAMEHVAGEPITQYCDRERLTIRQRLELFIPVCEAVQHAHHKGIIHRDIKPSNILVSVKEGAATPKVIDFGVAKAISHTLTEKTIFTEQGQLIGTPEYMSPEQAEMGATDVDTRTDVYSLGVVLYELLTGALPFEARSLRKAGYREIQRYIREVEAPKPSTRLTSLGAESAAVAQRRQMRTEELARELRRELEWVPLKALRKDRRERYRTPSDLADDLRRYIGGEPLEAGPEAVAYRVRKFVRRNRGAAFSAGAIFTALAGGLFGTTLQTMRLRVERDAAEQSAIVAMAATRLSNLRLAELHITSINDRSSRVNGIEDTLIQEHVEAALAAVAPYDLLEDDDALRLTVEAMALWSRLPRRPYDSAVAIPRTAKGAIDRLAHAALAAPHQHVQTTCIGDVPVTWFVASMYFAMGVAQGTGPTADNPGAERAEQIGLWMRAIEVGLDSPPSQVPSVDPYILPPTLVFRRFQVPSHDDLALTTASKLLVDDRLAGVDMAIGAMERIAADSGPAPPLWPVLNILAHLEQSGPTDDVTVRLVDQFDRLVPDRYVGARDLGCYGLSLSRAQLWSGNAILAQKAAAEAAGGFADGWRNMDVASHRWPDIHPALCLSATAGSLHHLHQDADSRGLDWHAVWDDWSAILVAASRELLDVINLRRNNTSADGHLDRVEVRAIQSILVAIAVAEHVSGVDLLDAEALRVDISQIVGDENELKNLEQQVARDLESYRQNPPDIEQFWRGL